MLAIWHVFRRELAAYFTGPIAWTVLTLFAILQGVFFFLLVSRFTQIYQMYEIQSQMGMINQEVNLNATEFVLRGLFFNLAVILLFLAPMVTMRLFAEEKQLGTTELLLTCPVRHVDVILGKFLAAMAVFGVMLLLSLALPIWLSFQTRLEIGPAIMGYLGLALLCAAFTGVGIFFSSLTENQIVAGAMTFATLLFLWLLSGLVDSATVTSGALAFLQKMSIIERYESFSEGVLNLGDAVYYLTVAALGLFLTHSVLDSQTT